MINLRPSPRCWRFLCLSIVVLAISWGAKASSTDLYPVFESSSPDPKVFYALGMIESGNDDRGIGSAGEISRYQIHPAVWRNYSQSRDYRNPELSLQVARCHWNYLTNYFRERTGHEPTPFDMYVLWNTRYGHYARKGFDRARLSWVVRERAERFVNLVNR